MAVDKVAELEAVPIKFSSKVTAADCVVTVKLVAEEAEPKELVTEMGPVAAPLGTVARSWMLESMVKVAAGVPLKATAVTFVKLLPVRVT